MHLSETCKTLAIQVDATARRPDLFYGLFSELKSTRWCWEWQFEHSRVEAHRNMFEFRNKDEARGQNMLLVKKGNFSMSHDNLALFASVQLTVYSLWIYCPNCEIH